MKNKFILIFGFLFFSLSANASFLRLIPNIQISSAENRPGFVIVAGTVENQGDETAYEIKIESIRGNKLLTNDETLLAGEQKEINVEVSEKDLTIEKEGGYSIPLRVLYKDANRAAFSAAFIVTYFKKNQENSLVRSAPVTLSLDEAARKNGGIDIANTGSMKLLIANTSANPVDSVIEFFGTKEIDFKINQKQVRLEPGEQKEVEVEIKNLSALPGSSYATYAAISGESEGQVFSEYLGFVVNVSSRAEMSFVTWSLVLLAAIFTAVGFFYFKRGSKEEGEPEA